MCKKSLISNCKGSFEDVWGLGQTWSFLWKNKSVIAEAENSCDSSSSSIIEPFSYCQCMCLRRHAVQYGTGQRAVVLCGWKGNDAKFTEVHRN